MAEYLKRGREAGTQVDAQVRERVATMLAEIASRGDAAVRQYSQSLDQHNPASFRLDDEEIARAISSVPADLRAHIDAAADNVRTFAQAQLGTLQGLEIEMAPGQFLGHRLVPVTSVGAYIPGGRYPLISSALMSILTGKVAGVERVVAMTAPTADHLIAPATLYAMTVAGADEIYALGG
ncbi:MAG: histidinol dehydrogenase, partial [Nakamurella sp.]